jgi:hypothetical protein
MSSFSNRDNKQSPITLREENIWRENLKTCIENHPEKSEEYCDQAIQELREQKGVCLTRKQLWGFKNGASLIEMEKAGLLSRKPKEDNTNPNQDTPLKKTRIEPGLIKICPFCGYDEAYVNIHTTSHQTGGLIIGLPSALPVYRYVPTTRTSQCFYMKCDKCFATFEPLHINSNEETVKNAIIGAVLLGILSAPIVAIYIFCDTCILSEGSIYDFQNDLNPLTFICWGLVVSLCAFLGLIFKEKQNRKMVQRKYPNFEVYNSEFFKKRSSIKPRLCHNSKTF